MGPPIDSPRASNSSTTRPKGRRSPPYHLEAGIALHHCTAKSYAETNWPAILVLYDKLLSIHRSPVYLLNRAIVVAEIEGPLAGIRALDEAGGNQVAQELSPLRRHARRILSPRGRLRTSQAILRGGQGEDSFSARPRHHRQPLGGVFLTSHAVVVGPIRHSLRGARTHRRAGRGRARTCARCRRNANKRAGEPARGWACAPRAGSGGSRGSAGSHSRPRNSINRRDCAFRVGDEQLVLKVEPLERPGLAPVRDEPLVIGERAARCGRDRCSRVRAEGSFASTRPRRRAGLAGRESRVLRARAARSNRGTGFSRGSCRPRAPRWREQASSGDRGIAARRRERPPARGSAGR